nr:MAG TPA: hypothetical protein [Caudoviricetes sp.]
MRRAWETCKACRYFLEVFHAMESQPNHTKNGNAVS